MTLLLTGISNENEFYTNYYMSEVLETDLKEITARWRSESDSSAIKAPPEQLRGISDSYFRFKNALKKESDPSERLTLQRAFSSSLLKILGYNQQPVNRVLDDGTVIPLLTEVTRTSGEPDVWILEAYSVTESVDGTDDPLALSFSANQFQLMDDPVSRVTDVCLEDLVSKQIFSQTEPPRWVIIVSDSQILLIDRSKWNDQRLLRFDLEEILARREASTLAATCLLLHHDNIASKQGQPLLDSLDEKSHKHSQAVTQDLKYALQQCIEIIGNEVIHYLRTTSKEKIYEREIEKQLAVETLRFMYRLLFILYIESRDELGYAPMKSDSYRLGYSFESLRDLEVLELTEEEARTSYYIHDSIKLLFDLIYNGYPEHQQLRDEYNQLFISYGSKESIQDNPNALRNFDFYLFPLRSHLFDPSKTPLLNKVRLRNAAMLQVLKLMSLSKAKGNKQRSGRISYAQLGINQLGAVYEALLCFKGFFAEEDLYEVQPAPKKSGRDASDEDEDESDFEDEADAIPAAKTGKGKGKGEAKKTRDALEIAYLVPKNELDKYTMDERVFDENGKQKFYSKGSFVYRLAGRDRQKSASYYTPEVLTECLVRYSLKELLKEKSADDILTLKICEPAMGSAAFLNECVNQLADAYLERKQNELGRRIPHDEYALEKQKVKMFIADRNVFGVDLNPIAVELAEVSLWLNSIHEGAFVPWFGMQLVCGNSLVGARRQTFSRDLLSSSRKEKQLWYENEPERVMPGSKRKLDHVYHFLLPDPSMSKYDDKVVKELAKDHIKAIDVWRSALSKPFTDAEENTALNLSTRIDELWKQHSEKLRAVRATTTDPLTIFGREETNLTKLTLTEQKDELFKQEGLVAEVSSSSAYCRLKFVMDYWCALWFWPILQSNHLPTRAEFFADIARILQESTNEENENLQEVLLQSERLGIVHGLVNRYRFMHWELEFADVFEDHGGFDLVIGNPPWIKLEWEPGQVLADRDPYYVVKGKSAPEIAKELTATIRRLEYQHQFFDAFEESDCMQHYLNAIQNYPSLRGIQSNLYKCFLPTAWTLCRSDGVFGFVHPQTIYSEVGADSLRQVLYAKLRYQFHFINELRLFNSPVDHRQQFSLNVYSNAHSPVFYAISNLFHPKTIDECLNTNSSIEDPLPGIKDEHGKWNIRGHHSRILEIGKSELHILGQIFDDTRGSTSSRLPSLQGVPVFNVLKKFANEEMTFANWSGKAFPTTMWEETAATKQGVILERNAFPDKIDTFIYSGPHFYVANPIAKTPPRIMGNRTPYLPVDLTTASDEYIPRSLYMPSSMNPEYAKKIPVVPWSKEPVTKFFRLICRKMICDTNERSLIVAIAPPHVGHIHAAVSLCFENTQNLVEAAGFFSALPYDFFIRGLGKDNLTPELIAKLPIPRLDDASRMMLQARILGLNCVTNFYEELWSQCWSDDFKIDAWSQELPNSQYFHELRQNWSRACALRSDLMRRQALLEIDVLVALAMQLSVAELQTLYRVQFPIVAQYDKHTFFDQTGRIVFTTNRGLPGISVDRKTWNQIKDMKSGVWEREIANDTAPCGPVKRTIAYHAPFFSMNRERDYEVAWKELSSRLGITHSVLIHKDEQMSSII